MELKNALMPSGGFAEPAEGEGEMDRAWNPSPYSYSPPTACPEESMPPFLEDLLKSHPDANVFVEDEETGKVKPIPAKDLMKKIEEKLKGLPKIKRFR